MIDVGDVTTWLVNLMDAKFISDEAPFTSVMVGDGVAPLEAGWLESQPNSPAGFVPYVVIRQSSPVTSLMGDVPLCDTVATRLSIVYSVVAYANTRAGADLIAARSRDHLKALDPGPWQHGDLSVRGNQVFIDSLTGAVRDDSVYPAMWSAATNVRLSVARTAGVQVP